MDKTEEGDQVMGWGCQRKQSSERKRATIASLPQGKKRETWGGEEEARQSKSLF